MGEYVTVEQGVKLYVEDINPAGTKTIVFLHGWPLNHNQFEYQFNVLPGMGYRCIGIDWRGFGKSDRPYGGYRLERLADDIRAVVEALQLQDFVLAGHSTGGAIAIQYVSRYNGGDASKLVLIDAAAPRGFTPETAAQLLKMTLNDRANMMLGVTNLFFFQSITQPFSDWFNRMGMAAAGWSTAAIIVMLRDFDLTAELARIRIPTLIVHGIHDQVIPFSQAEEMHRIVPHSQLVPFLYSGHGSFYEERDKFNQLLHEFVGAVRR